MLKPTTMKNSILRMSGILMLGLPIIMLSSCKKAPTADFTHTATELEVAFTFTGEGDVDAYSWSFGDGETSTEENPTHTYAAGGDYSVSLTVTNTNGNDTKSETVTVEGAAATSSNPALTFGDADGAFYAINTNTVQNTGGFSITIAIGTAVAWFQDAGTFVNVGDVAWHQGSDSETLDYLTESKTYNWVETTQPSNGFDDNGIDWTITGGNGFDAITGTDLTNANPFPTAKEIDESDDVIDGSASYTISHVGAIDNADSIYFSIYGPDATVLKRMGAGTTSASISASEMSSLGKGNAIIQIAAFNIHSGEASGKKLYMVNEAVASKTVTIE
jgi:PKD repeat protein